MTREPTSPKDWEKFSTQLHKGMQRKLKVRCVQEGREIRQVVSELVRRYLENQIEI